MEKPKLSHSFAKGLAFAASRRGWWAYLPKYLISCIAIGSIAACNAPSSLWEGDDLSDILTIYGGGLTFNGILMAVGWSSFAKSYELIGSGPFSAFLRKHGALEMHILFIDIAQISLLVSTIISGSGLIFSVTGMETWFNKLIFATSIGSTLYAVAKCIAVTQMMQELVWESSDFKN